MDCQLTSNVTYIGFSKNPGFISRVIRFIDRSKASHVWVRTYSPLLGEYVVFESAKEGFRIIPFRLFSKHNIIVHEEPVEATEEELKTLFHMVGRPYDYKGIFKFLVRRVLRYIVPTILEWKTRSTPGVMTCTEAISRWKPDLFPGNPEWATPRKMLRQLNNRVLT